MTDQLEARAICVGRHQRREDEKPVYARRPHLCDGCRDRLYQHLVALPDLARMARLNTQGLHGTPSDGRVSGSKHQPLPGGTLIALFGPAAGEHLSAYADVRDQDGIVPIPNILGGWVQLVCEERLLSGPSSDLKSVCSFLREHSEWIADQPFADDFDAEIRDVHSRLTAAAGMSEPTTRYQYAICSDCGAMGSLVYANGRDFITCAQRLGGCGARIPWDSHSASVIRAEDAAEHEARQRIRPTRDDPERSIRAHGADVRDEDFLRAEVILERKSAREAS